MSFLVLSVFLLRHQDMSVFDDDVIVTSLLSLFSLLSNNLLRFLIFLFLFAGFFLLLHANEMVISFITQSQSFSWCRFPCQANDDCKKNLLWERCVFDVSSRFVSKERKHEIVFIWCLWDNPLISRIGFNCHHCIFTLLKIEEEEVRGPSLTRFSLLSLTLLLK